MDSLDSPLTKDESYLVDKLRTIRPFTESQLLTLYNNDELKANQQFVINFVEENLRINDHEFYQLLINLERAKERQVQCTCRITELKSLCESLQEKIWQLNSKVMSGSSKCSDGQNVEAKHQYNEAQINNQQIKQLENNLIYLRETLVNDYCSNYYHSQMAQLEVESKISDILEENDKNIRRLKVKKAISALFALHRKPKSHDETFLDLTKNWLINLVGNLISNANLEDHLFLLNHVLRCPAGSSLWNASFVQCKSINTDSENINLFVNHSLTVISTILSPIIARESFLGVDELKKKDPKSNDETWLLVDPEEDGAEEVTSSHLQIAEIDVIRYLKQVPFEHILEYITNIGHSSDVSNGSSHEETSELIMLRLLAISTILIKILKEGLQTFNCIRFKSLTELISHFIRRTVLTVSNFWNKCKERFMSHDKALILRLQVEYDHFILRSISAILSTNRQGVWRFLAVFPFDGVSESMMWHILWVVYNNGRDELDDLGGLCPYFSDTYWKSKFQEATVQFLFREKLSSLSESESHCLLITLFNMAKSRVSSENEFTSTVASEIFEISFQTPSLADKMTDKGQKLLCILTQQYNFLVGVFLDKISEENINDSILDLFTDVPIKSWVPGDDKLTLLYEWLICMNCNNLLNRLARLTLSRLNWNINQNPDLNIHVHRQVAIKIYEAINSNNFISKDVKIFPHCNLKQYGFEKFIALSKSVNINDYIKWSWLMLITLKLHVLDDANFDWNSLFTSNVSLTFPQSFNPVPNILDSNLVSIYRGLESKNRFAIYISLIMTDIGHCSSSMDKYFDCFENLLVNLHYIPSLEIFSNLFLFNINQMEFITSNSKLISALSQMMIVQSEEIVSMISYQLSKINEENKLILIINWFELLYEVTGTIFKLSASSWFGSTVEGVRELGYIYDKIIMLTYSQESLYVKLVRYLSQHPYDIQSWKLPTPGLLSSLFNWGSSGIKKCEWITPLHLLNRNFPSYSYLGCVVIESDSIRMEKVWEDIITELTRSSNFDNIELVIKAICTKQNLSPIPLSFLPLFAWCAQIVNSPINHELEVINWYKFFIVYFFNSDSSASVGMRLLNDKMKRKLNQRLNYLIDYHHRLWMSKEQGDIETNIIHDDLTKLYRAYVTWLEDSRLHEVFINLDELPTHYMTSLLKCVMTNSPCRESLSHFIDLKQIQVEKSLLEKIWNDLRINNTNSNTFEESSEEICKYSEFIGNTTILDAPEDKRENIFIFSKSVESINDKSAFHLLIQNNIRFIIEEAKFFETRMNKYDTLNKTLLEQLPDLYRNMKKDVKYKIPCEKNSYDHCAGPAIIVIEFKEAVLNQPIFKIIERNRIDFENVISELIETPSNKIVASTLFIEKCLSLCLKNFDFYTIEQENLGTSLLGPLLLWLNKNNDILYSPAKHTFTILMDALAQAAELKPDETNLYILEIAMNYPKIIQYFAPRLEPSKCSAECFLTMYQQLETKLNHTPSKVSFVLLSKFDMAQWLKCSSYELCLSLINVLGNALYAIGNNPSDEKLIVLGLYRKHLQYVIIHYFPDNLKNVLQILLKGMTDVTIAPSLWNDVLLSFGFFLKTDNYNQNQLFNELKKYANNQPLFSAHELYDLLDLLSSYFTQIYKEHPLEILDHFKIYVQQFIIVLSTLSFCWINTNSRMPPSDIKNIWEPFYNIWKVYLFPKRSTKFINETDIKYVWASFAMNLHYFIECFQGMLSDILSCVWQVVLSYILDTKAIFDTDISIIHYNLSNLPWFKFSPCVNDIKIMLNACQQEKYDISSFISHVVLKINWPHSFQQQLLRQENLQETLEDFAYSLILISTKKIKLNENLLNEIPFHILTSSKVQIISQLIIKEINVSSYLLEQNQKEYRRDKFLFSLFKKICLLEPEENDWFTKHLIYTHNVLYMIVNCCQLDEESIKLHCVEFKSFISQILIDLKPAILSNDYQRFNLLEKLFNLLNLVVSENCKYFIMEQYKTSFDFNDTKLLLDILKSLSQSIKTIQDFLTISEPIIEKYFINNGELSELFNGYEIQEHSPEEFVAACGSKSSYLNLYLYVFLKLKEDDKKIMFVFLNWCSSLKPTDEDEAKVLLLWYKALEWSFNLNSEELSDMMHSVQQLTKHLLTIVEENVSQSFLSFVKFNKKPFSVRFTFLTLCISFYGCQRLINNISSSHILYSDFKHLQKSIVSKFQNLKKNKSFFDLSAHIEIILELANDEDKLSDMNELIKNWIIQYYIEVQYIKTLIESESKK